MKDELIMNREELLGELEEKNVMLKNIAKVTDVKKIRAKLGESGKIFEIQ